MQRGFAPILILLIVGIVVLAGVGEWWWKNNQSPGPGEQMACSAEAKICPDGTGVGRTGPNCEFAACPASTTYKNQEFGFQFDYPSSSHVSHDSRMEFDDYNIGLEDKNLTKIGDTEFFSLDILDNSPCSIAINKKAQIVKKIFGENEYSYNEGDDGNGTYIKFACLVHNKSAYLFSNRVSHLEDADISGKLFEKVLATFKFTSVDITNWKTYTGNDYSFQYPTDWILNSSSSYLDSVSVENPKKTVNILISKGQYPYGFGAQQDVKINNINVMVGDKTYQAKELVTGGKKAYVDLKLDNPGDYHILFGTGYPAGSDTNYSIQDYQDSKTVILKILATFKFN